MAPRDALWYASRPFLSHLAVANLRNLPGASSLGEISVGGRTEKNSPVCPPSVVACCAGAVVWKGWKFHRFVAVTTDLTASLQRAASNGYNDCRICRNGVGSGAGGQL